MSQHVRQFNVRRSKGRLLFLLGAHRQADDFVIEIVAVHARIDHETLAIDATRCGAQQKDCGVRHFLRGQVLLTESQLFSIQITFQIAGDPRRSTGLERTGIDRIEAYAGIRTKGFGQIIRRGL